MARINHVHSACRPSQALLRALSDIVNAGKTHLGWRDAIHTGTPHAKADITFLAASERETCLHYVERLNDRETQRREQKH
jgi:hypothetical protein